MPFSEQFAQNRTMPTSNCVRSSKVRQFLSISSLKSQNHLPPMRIVSHSSQTSRTTIGGHTVACVLHTQLYDSPHVQIEKLVQADRLILSRHLSLPFVKLPI